MSEKKARAAAGQGQLCASSAAAPADFSELWKNVSKLTRGKTPENRKAHASTEHASPRFTGDPKRRGRFPGVSNADSPGDLEPSQDIFWDSTSPTQNNAGFRRTKVEISDLVNRIAPKVCYNEPQKSTLLQWIGDSAVPCTPDIPKQRTKKSVEHLMELARQFDENMQQDKETSEKMNIINNNINKPANPADNKEKVQLAVPCDSGEAELRALFDSSTQKVSGALSQASTSSAGSQKVRLPPVMSLSKKVPETNTCDDFDEAWENQLLSDPLLVALTQNPEQHIATTQTNLQSKSKHISEGESSSANANHVPKVSKEYTKPSYSALQALCPKPKTTNRSTFKLGPDPVVHPLIEPPESTFTALKSSHHTEQKSTAADDFSDSLWDDGDDALLYEVCDSVERISNSQTYKVNQSEQRGQDESDVPKNRLHKPTAPLPIIATNTSANKQPGAFVLFLTKSSPNNSSVVRFIFFFSVVCVTSEMRGKCSAAEIEKKKQEALARRRQRMQNSQKT
uniref:ETAA1 activator of ATR kinase n=1 Tax=Periophthalmus magnuspinnatus TaxID=409849 RepID=A0A3B4A2I7_9GOBI